MVLTGWLLAVGAAVAVLALLGGSYRTDFQLPGTDSQRATDALNADFSGGQGDHELLVVHATNGSLHDATQRAAISRLVTTLRRLPDVAAVGAPLDPASGTISSDGRTAVAVLRFRESADAVPIASIRRVLTIVNAANGTSIDVGMIGQGSENAQASAPSPSEKIAFLTAVVLLLVAYGSAAAVTLTLITAGFALGVGLGAMALVSHVVAIPTFATQVATTTGLGVGIDYALLVIARYRAFSAAEAEFNLVVADTMRASGRAVVFAGSTVMVAMFGLYAVPLPFVHGLAIGVSLVVLPTIAAATTLLPALLGHLGQHLGRWQVPGLQPRTLGGHSPRWASWSQRVQRRPIIAGGAALALLTLLSLPVLALRIGNTEASTDNIATPSHRAYIYATQAFGRGFTDRFIVVATPAPSANIHSAERVVRATLATTSGVAALGPVQLSKDGRQFAIDVYPASAPTSLQRGQLLAQLRGPVQSELSTDSMAIAVGGTAATSADLAHAVTHALPVVLAAVIGVSLLLLLVVFRSVVVAVKAGLMNLLSVAAGFGVVVAVFQWGWGLHLIGVDYPSPLEAFLPLLLFPVVFGLSMDYEVFLVSSIRDAWIRTGNNSEAVTEGVATTARIVTAGATIMTVLFAALVFANARTVKMFGLAMAIAIAVDALIVRSLLLPATMQLLGPRNWWLPRWLDRRLPRLHG